MTKQTVLFGKKFDEDGIAKLSFLSFIFVASLIFIQLAIMLWESTSQKREMVGRIKQLIESSQKASTNKTDINEPSLFSGENLAEIQSELQSKIKQIGDTYRISIDSIQALDPINGNNFVISRIRLNGAIPEKDFTNFLLNLSADQPSVFVSDMDIRPAGIRSARVANVEEIEPKLSIQLVFSGLSKVNSSFAVR